MSIPPPLIRRFSVDEYHRMIDAGVFAHDERHELIDGWITVKMPRNPPHDSYLAQVDEVIGNHLPTGWHVRGQSAITLATSEPEPDLAVVPGPARRYRTAHPGPAEVALVVEVADSSLDYDCDVKGPIYAGAAIPFYWIVNLVDRRVEVYSDPTGAPVSSKGDIRPPALCGPPPAPAYRQMRHALLADTVDLVIAGQTVAAIPVQELLG